jgi:exodeoxyribonuclease VII small subunit
MAGDTKKLNFADSINKLEEINSWFQTEDIDLDEGLKKLKEGKDLIKKCRERLAEVENEFVKIKEEFTEETVTVSSDVEEEVVGSQQTLIGIKKEVPDTEDIPF